MKLLSPLVRLLWWMGWRIARNYLPFLFLLGAWMMGSIMGDSFYPRLFNSFNWVMLGMGVAVTLWKRESSGGNRKPEIDHYN